MVISAKDGAVELESPLTLRSELHGCAALMAEVSIYLEFVDFETVRHVFRG